MQDTSDEIEDVLIAEIGCDKENSCEDTSEDEFEVEVGRVEDAPTSYGPEPLKDIPINKVRFDD